MKSLKQYCNASIWGDQVAPGSRGMTMMNLISCRNFVYIRYRRNSPKRVCSSILWYYILYLLLSAISERISFRFFLCSSFALLFHCTWCLMYFSFSVFTGLCLFQKFPMWAWSQEIEVLTKLLMQGCPHFLLGLNEKHTQQMFGFCGAVTVQQISVRDHIHPSWSLVEASESCCMRTRWQP